MRLIVMSLVGLALSWGASSADTIEATLTDTEGFSGVVLVGDIQGGERFYAHGFADDATKRPFVTDDVWRWASVTKQLVAVLVMQQVDAGRLSLTDTLAERLPEAKTRHAKAITIADLLRHTSGLRPPTALPTINTDPIAFCTGRPMGRPGKRFVYNNCDTVLAAAIVERASGSAWQELIREDIFAAAGMTTTLAKPFGEKIETVAGQSSQGQPEPDVDVALYGAAGSLIGQASDLIAFNNALMQGQLLTAKARDALWEGVPELGFVALGAWSFRAPLKDCDGPIHLVERRGHIQGVQARNFIAPELGKSLVIFVNRGDFDFGEVWRGEGFSYTLLSEALCRAE